MLSTVENAQDTRDITAKGSTLISVLRPQHVRGGEGEERAILSIALKRRVYILEKRA